MRSFFEILYQRIALLNIVIYHTAVIRFRFKSETVHKFYIVMIVLQIIAIFIALLWWLGELQKLFQYIPNNPHDWISA